MTPQGPNVTALMTLGLVVLVSQTALAILFKLVFFKYIAEATVSPGETTTPVKTVNGTTNVF